MIKNKYITIDLGRDEWWQNLFAGFRCWRSNQCQKGGCQDLIASLSRHNILLALFLEDGDYQWI